MVHDGLLYKKIAGQHKLAIPSKILAKNFLELHLKCIHNCDFYVDTIIERKFYIPGFGKARQEDKQLCTTCTLNQPALPQVRHREDRTINYALLPNQLHTLDSLHLKQNKKHII